MGSSFSFSTLAVLILCSAVVAVLVDWVLGIRYVNPNRFRIAVHELTYTVVGVLIGLYVALS